MNKKPISECDSNADKAINAMMATVVGTAMIPAAVNWALTATAMGAGVVAVGVSYDVKLNKEEGWKLVKQFVIGAGFWFVAMNIGAKIFALIVESTGIGYGVGVALDGAISGAMAWAIGNCAKAYFRQDYLGKGKPSKEELGAIFRDFFQKKKNETK